MAHEPVQVGVNIYRQPLHLYDTMDVSGLISEPLFKDSRGAPVSQSYRTDHRFLRPEQLAIHQSADNPLRITYHAPAHLRAVAMAIEHPGHIVCGLSALSVFGLRFFADSCDTTLFWKVHKTIPPTQFTPLILREPDAAWWDVTFRNVPLRISPPHLALVHAIMHLRAGRHRWSVFPVPGFDPLEIRIIQLIDAARRHLGLILSEFFNACRTRLNRAWIERLAAFTSNKADSPKETEMRLICQAICDELGLTLAEQVPVMNGDRWVTTFDLAIDKLRIGIMYDGDHHLQRSQRDKDSRINLECAALDWQVLRVTAGTLHEVRHYLLQAIEVQLRRIAG